MYLAITNLGDVADLVTIVGLPLTLIALGYAIASFRSADRAASEAAATTVLQSYLQLRADHPKVGFYIDNRKDDELNDEELNYTYGWIGLHALFTAEQIYIWKGDDRSWHETATKIVADNKKFVKHWGEDKYPRDPFFIREYYSEDFQTFIDDIVHRERTQHQ